LSQDAGKHEKNQTKQEAFIDLHERSIGDRIFNFTSAFKDSTGHTMGREKGLDVVQT